MGFDTFRMIRIHSFRYSNYSDLSLPDRLMTSILLLGQLVPSIRHAASTNPWESHRSTTQSRLVSIALGDGPVKSTMTNFVFDITWINDFDKILIVPFHTFWLFYGTAFDLGCILQGALVTIVGGKDRTTTWSGPSGQLSPSFSGEMTKLSWLVNDFGCSLSNLYCMYVRI